ncbi:MAG TPA: hypothetical protein VFG95_08550 [Nitrospiria bacterium]|nr:hypothetical protein [Nitrospiria bacterium]
MIRYHLESSYITVRGKINVGGKLKRDDLLFEAEIEHRQHWQYNHCWLVNKGSSGTPLVNFEVHIPIA